MQEFRRPDRHPARGAAASGALILVAAAAVALTPSPAAATPQGCTENENVVTCTSATKGGALVRVPEGMNQVRIAAQGGAGGDGSGGMDPGRGGPGATATATFPVHEGQALRLFVGAEGEGTKRSAALPPVGGADASMRLSARGGDLPIDDLPALFPRPAGQGGAGGGGTFVFTGEGSPDSGAMPLIVAGGGGGGGGVSPRGARVLGDFGNSGGHGGASAGEHGGGDGGGQGATTTRGGLGGTNAPENSGADGQRVVGGEGAKPRDDSDGFAGGGGGGGGYFGGGGGASAVKTVDKDGIEFAGLGGGGGGGSSFIAPGAIKPAFGVANALTGGSVTLVFSAAKAAAAETCAGLKATIVGTPGPDVLTGTPGRDVIVARGGNDVIRARGGDDIICAGAGDDRIFGGKGLDLAITGGGRDILDSIERRHK
jgi:hypothetical protein